MYEYPKITNVFKRDMDAPGHPLYTKKGERIMAKIKTRDFENMTDEEYKRMEAMIADR